MSKIREPEHPVVRAALVRVERVSRRAQVIGLAAGVAAAVPLCLADVNGGIVALAVLVAGRGAGWAYTRWWIHRHP
jgi:hypothetical protein